MGSLTCRTNEILFCVFTKKQNLSGSHKRKKKQEEDEEKKRHNKTFMEIM